MTCRGPYSFKEPQPCVTTGLLDVLENRGGDPDGGQVRS